MYLGIGAVSVRFVSETPYLIQYTAIAPHITGSGVLHVAEYLRSTPLDRNTSSISHIVVLVQQIPRHAKVSNL